MRISGVLSKLPSPDFKQVDSFLIGKKGEIGQRVNLNSDIRVTSEYYCALCEDTVVFVSQGSLSCVFISTQSISIDCVLACDCGVSVPVWFLVESYDNIIGQAPEVRLIERKDRLSENVKNVEFDEYTELLNKSERAYRDGLGAGSTIYLRKIFEKVTVKAADYKKIQYKKYKGGNPKNFFALLEKVDKAYPIIPEAFSADGYKLYRQLSDVIHDTNDEKIGLEKYLDFRRLVVGIIDKIKSNEKAEKDHVELKASAAAIGLGNEEGGDNE